jgi:hypothetical protein
MYLAVVLLLSIGLTPSIASFHEDIYNEITQKYPGLDHTSFFCPNNNILKENCGNYIDSLNQMLSSTSAMISTLPLRVASPVRPVIVPFKISNDVEILDEETAHAFQLLSTEDDFAAKKAIADLKADPDSTAADIEDLTIITSEISSLRKALGSLVDLAYEGTFTGLSVSLSELAPVIRGIGSIFQRVLFNWQLGSANNEKFYTSRLLQSEKNYLEYFFNLYGYEQYNFQFGLWYGNRMSSFTWSHRSSQATENSVRFACGTTSQKEPFQLMGLKVLKEKFINLSNELNMSSESLSFYGLGWDLQENNFKVYMMFHGIDALPLKYKKLANETLLEVGIDFEHADISRHGLISLTYYDQENSDSSNSAPTSTDGSSTVDNNENDSSEDKRIEGDDSDKTTGDNCDGDVLSYYDPNSNTNSDEQCVIHNKKKREKKFQLHEEKVYLYPTVDEAYKQQGKHEIKPLDGLSTSNVAWLLASKRGFVPQFDTIITPDSELVWRERLGAKG